MAKKTKNPAYAAYASKGNFAKNALRKVQRHLKKHPNDTQAQKALKSVPGSPTRKKPLNKGGWVSEDVRSFMSHLPFLTPMQGRVYNQQVVATKTNVTSYAQIRKFLKASPFMKTLVLIEQLNEETKEEVLLPMWKHTSKLSNFHKLA